MGYQQQGRCWSWPGEDISEPKKRGTKNDIYLLVLPFQISRPLLSVSCAAFSSRHRVFGRSFPGAYNDVCSRASIIKIIYHIILEFVVTSSQALAVDSSLTRNDNHSSCQPRTTPRMTTENSSTAISVKRARRPSPGKILKNIIYLYIYNSVM